MSWTAIYVSADTFQISGDVSDQVFPTAIAAVECGGVYVFSSIESVSYGAGYTTIVLVQSVLTDPCADVKIGPIWSGPNGNTPTHTHEDDLTGGTGVVGSPAQYVWDGTAVSFKNPDGSWGPYVDLAGMVWEGAWALSNVYSVNDGVENDGSTYICIYTHFANATTEPGTGVYWETYWGLVASKGDQGDKGDKGDTGDTGSAWNWEGGWQPGGWSYHEDDGVGYNGSSYICLVDHNSSASSEPGIGVYWEDYWGLVVEKGDKGDTGDTGATGTTWDWQGPWAVGHGTYSVDDGVENDGSSYICVVEHSSDTTTEPGVGTYWEDYWDLVAEKGDKGDQGDQGIQGTKGIIWHSAWADSHAYVIDEAVENDGSSYICTVGHTSDTSNEPGVGVYWEDYWDLVAEKGDTGTTGSAWDWHGQWVLSHDYVPDDGVFNDGSSYICTVGHTSDASTEPGVGTYWEDYWDLVVEKGDQGIQGLKGDTGDTGTAWDWHGPWVESHAYVTDDGVENDGSSYICTAGHTSDTTTEPGVGTYWEDYWDLVAEKGDKGDTGNTGPGVVIQAGTVTATNGTVLFSNANGVSFGLTDGTMTASISVTGGAAAGTLDFYHNEAPQVTNNVADVWSSNTHGVFPFIMPANGSFDFLRFIMSVTCTAATFATTTGTSYFTHELSSIYRVGIYSRGTGTASKKLVSVATTSGPFLKWNLTFSGVSQAFSETASYEFGSYNSNSTLTSSAQAGLASYRISSADLGYGVFKGLKFVDIPFPVTLQPGAYWLQYNMTSSHSGDGPATLFSTMSFAKSVQMMSYNATPMNFGTSGTIASDALYPAHGSLSIAAGATTSVIEMTNLTVQGAQNRPYFQLLKAWI